MSNTGGASVTLSSFGAGIVSVNVPDHKLKLCASRFLPTDDAFIPTGIDAPVADTPMDFRNFKQIGRDVNAEFPDLHFGKGYNTCWVVDDHKNGA